MILSRKDHCGSEGEDRVFHWLAVETGLRSGELAGLRLSDIDGERLTVNHSVWLGREQAGKTNNAIRSLALSPQLISSVEQIARQRAKGHEYLFSSKNGKPRDMNVYRRRKMIGLLKSLEIPQAGFHAFTKARRPQRHAEDDQERIGHALTGSYPLDVHGGQPEWGRNLEAAQHLGAEFERAVNETIAKLENAAQAVTNNGLSPFKERGSGADIS